MNNLTHEIQQITVKEIKVLRHRIAVHTAGIPSERKYQLQEVLDLVPRIFSELMEKEIVLKDSDLRYLQKLKLVELNQNDQGYYQYSLRDIRDILLISILREGWNKPYSEIGGLLYQESIQNLNLIATGNAKQDLRVSQDQSERGIFFWRSNLINAVMQLLFGGQVPPKALIFLSKNPHINNKVSSDLEPWIKATKNEFLEIDSSIENSPLHLVTTLDGEVFHNLRKQNNWKQHYKDNWYKVIGGNYASRWDYELIVCIPNNSDHQFAPPISDKPVCLLLIKLLEACFVGTNKESEVAGSLKSETQLNVLVNLVPDLSPKWQYCACLIPSDSISNRLLITTSSKYFPEDSKEKIQVLPGQMLTGYAFLHNYPVEIQNAVKHDPRTNHDKVLAAIAIPTFTTGKPNGVLYVGTRSVSDQEVPFTPIEKLLLQVIGQIAGRLVETETTRKKTNLTVIDKGQFPSDDFKEWADFKNGVFDLISTLSSTTKKELLEANLHFLTIKIKNYDELTVIESKIAEWVYSQICQTTSRFYIESKIGTPLLFNRKRNELVAQVYPVIMSDAEEHSLRSRLHLRLNSLSLPFSQNMDPFRVVCELWSLPFRASQLRTTVNDKGIELTTNEIIKSIEQSFEILSFIYRAHECEKEGAWHLALEQYQMAYAIAQDNSYIWRHLAKTLTQLGEYQKSISWWLQIIANQRHPSHYRRLAFNLACEGEIQRALNFCEKAVELDPHDAKSYRDWGRILLESGDYKKAIEKFDLAAAYDEQNRAHYRLNIAEAYFKIGDKISATNACLQARTYEPNNPNIASWILKIASARTIREDNDDVTQDRL